MVDIAIETLDYDALTRLRDACKGRLLRRTEGLPLSELLRLLEEVKTTLRDQGKVWYSLERWCWDDGQIRFWLNPFDHTQYRMGQCSGGAGSSRRQNSVMVGVND